MKTTNIEHQPHPGRSEPAWVTKMQMPEPAQQTYKLYWSPEGKCIGTAVATSAKAACRKAPLPYRKFLGEIYAELA